LQGSRIANTRLTLPAQVEQGRGVFPALCLVRFPDGVTLRAGSPAVNAADPQAPYELELGYNGGWADLGAYGNTWRAPQQPPLDQMAVSLTTATPTLSGRPGQTLAYTLTLQNSGSVTDTYGLQAILNDPEFVVSFAQDYERAYRFIDLGPQEQTSIPVWVHIPFSSSLTSSYTITIGAIGRYDIQDEVDLVVQIASFQEENGQVVIEAEHFAQNVARDGWSWQPETALGGYVGEGYIAARPDTDRQFITDFTTTSPELHYTINFTDTGTYYVWLRGYAPNGAGDSVYLGLDGPSANVLTGLTPRMWDWANTGTQSNPVTIEITQPGLHTFHLWQREDGIRLDRILLTTNNQYTPTGDGPPESQTGSNP
jgi:hypothetical protein